MTHQRAGSTRVSDVLGRQLRTVVHITEASVWGTCPQCSTTQTFDQASVSSGGGETTYTCRNGCQPLLIVSAAEQGAWPGRGYRMGPHLLRNAVDLFVQASSGASVLFPASPNALEAN